MNFNVQGSWNIMIRDYSAAFAGLIGIELIDQIKPAALKK